MCQPALQDIIAGSSFYFHRPVKPVLNQQKRVAVVQISFKQLQREWLRCTGTRCVLDFPLHSPFSSSVTSAQLPEVATGRNNVDISWLKSSGRMFEETNPVARKQKSFAVWPRDVWKAFETIQTKSFSPLTTHNLSANVGRTADLPDAALLFCVSVV